MEWQPQIPQRGARRVIEGPVSAPPMPSAARPSRPSKRTRPVHALGWTNLGWSLRRMRQVTEAGDHPQPPEHPGGVRAGREAPRPAGGRRDATVVGTVRGDGHVRLGGVHGVADRCGAAPRQRVAGGRSPGYLPSSSTTARRRCCSGVSAPTPSAGPSAKTSTWRRRSGLGFGGSARTVARTSCASRPDHCPTTGH